MANRQGQGEGPTVTDGLWRRTDEELIDGIAGATRTMFAQQVSLLDLTAELAGRGTTLGNAAQAATTIVENTTLSLYAARKLVTLARRLHERPRVYESYAAAQIPEASALAILDFLDSPPAAMTADEVARAEISLLDDARTSGSRQLSALIDGIREYYAAPRDDAGDDAGGDGDGAGGGAGAGDGDGDGAAAGPQTGTDGQGTDGRGGGEAGRGEGSGDADGAGQPDWPRRRRSDTFGGDDTTRNTLFLSRTLGGRYVLRGDLDAETGERLSIALSPLSAPRPEADGTRDRRSGGKRRADGLAEYLRRHAVCSASAPGRSGACACAGGTGGNGGCGTNSGNGTQVSGHDFGGGAGTGATLSVHVRLRTLTDTDADHARRAELIAQGHYSQVFGDLPHGLTDWFGLMPVSAVRRLACDAAVTPIGVDENGVPLNVGRTRRLATPAQRRALAARDHGCAFPHCDRPPAWCIAHHVLHWVDGGRTDLTNLVFLCPEHHRSVHHHGWTVVIDRTTRSPRFLPPPGDRLAHQWLDSDGTPAPQPQTGHGDDP